MSRHNRYRKRNVHFTIRKKFKKGYISDVREIENAYKPRVENNTLTKNPEPAPVIVEPSNSRTQLVILEPSASNSPVVHNTVKPECIETIAENALLAHILELQTLVRSVIEKQESIENELRQIKYELKNGTGASILPSSTPVAGLPEGIILPLQTMKELQKLEQIMKHSAVDRRNLVSVHVN